MADGGDFLNGAHDGVRVDPTGIKTWAGEMAYLLDMYQPLTPLEDDAAGGPTVDAALQAEAAMYGRHVDAAGFMLDHVYAVEGTIGDVRTATIAAADLHTGTDADNAAALAAAERSYADKQNDPEAETATE